MASMVGMHVVHDILLPHRVFFFTKGMATSCGMDCWRALGVPRLTHERPTPQGRLPGFWGGIHASAMHAKHVNGPFSAFAWRPIQFILLGGFVLCRVVLERGQRLAAQTMSGKPGPISCSEDLQNRETTKRGTDVGSYRERPEVRQCEGLPCGGSTADYRPLEARRGFAGAGSGRPGKA